MQRTRRFMTPLLLSDPLPPATHLASLPSRFAALILILGIFAKPVPSALASGGAPCLPNLAPIPNSTAYTVGLLRALTRGRQ